VPNTAKGGKVSRLRRVAQAALFHQPFGTLGPRPRESGVGGLLWTGIIWCLARELSLQTAWKPAPGLPRFVRQESTVGQQVGGFAFPKLQPNEQFFYGSLPQLWATERTCAAGFSPSDKPNLW
jgi:hypothetical protein